MSTDRRAAGALPGRRGGQHNRDRTCANVAVVLLLVVDDETAFVRSMTSVVRETRGFEVVGEAPSGEESVVVVADGEPGPRAHRGCLFACRGPRPSVHAAAGLLGAVWKCSVGPRFRPAPLVPLTLSHAAAVLPLRRLGFPVTALVVGCMAPDLPLFLRWPRGYELARSLLGIASIDVVVTLVVVCSLLPATVVVGAAGGVTTEAMQGSSRSHALLFECVVEVLLAGVVGVTAVCLAWRRVLRRATIGWVHPPNQPHTPGRRIVGSSLRGGLRLTRPR
jgi:hypothetical protein